MAINRKSFLKSLGLVAGGGAIGAVAGRVVSEKNQSPPVDPAAKSPPRGEETFSQCGEDRIAHFIFDYLRIDKVDYLDIGAYDPTFLNNTYLFYRKGRRGVLIEPNGSMCLKLRETRPEDKVLEAGIGVTAQKEADYYVTTDPSWNTFSKEEAERQSKVSGGRISIVKVVKVPLLDINQVMADHFGEAPAFLSVDTQGFELPILKSINFGRFRPKIICTETLVTGTRKKTTETEEFLVNQGYVVRGMTFVNTLFVDSKII